MLMYNIHNVICTANVPQGRIPHIFRAQKYKYFSGNILKHLFFFRHWAHFCRFSLLYPHFNVSLQTENCIFTTNKRYDRSQDRRQRAPESC